MYVFYCIIRAKYPPCMYSTVYYVLRKISTPLVTRKCMCPLTVGRDPGTLLTRTYISAYIVCLFLSAHIYMSVHCVYICWRACVRVPHIDTRKCVSPHPGWELSGSRRSLPGSQSPRVPESPRGEKVFTAGTLRGPTWHLGAT